MKKSRLSMLLLFVTLGCLAALFAACGSSAEAANSINTNQITAIRVHNNKNNHPKPKPKPRPTPTMTTRTSTIKIGLDLPLSGTDASLGQPAENGALLAINQANSSKTLPGYTFQLVAKDDANATTGLPDAALAANNVTALIQDAQVSAIIGAFDTTTAEAELPIANKAGIPLISPSATYTCLTQQSTVANCGTLLSTLRPTGKTTFFRLAPTDIQQGQAQANYAYQARGYRKVYVIDDTSAYGIGLAASFISSFQTNGGVVVGHVSSPATTASYINVLTQAAALKPDIIFYAGSDAGGVTVRRQMLQIPGLSNVPFLGGNGIHTTTFANGAGNFGAPVYSTAPSLTLTTGTFVPQYQAAYGTPGIYSAAGYDSANILLTALKATIAKKVAAPGSSNQTGAATTFRTSLVSSVAQVVYTGAAGIKYAFNANGDPVNNTVEIDVLQSGQWASITTEPVV